MQPPKSSQQLQVKFEHARELHRRGAVAQAQKIYQEILNVEPGHFDCLHLLGVSHAQAGEFERAVDLISVALSINSNNALAHFNRGNALKDIERFGEALVSFEHALELRSDYAEAHNNRGITLLKLGRAAEALTSYEAAVSFKPHYAQAWYNHGVALMELRRFNEALVSFEKTLDIEPRYLKALNNRAISLKELERFEDALVSYDEALELDPRYVEAIYNKANALAALKRFEEALAAYDSALAIDPNHAGAHLNRGNALKTLERFDEALASYDKALSLKLDEAESHNNRGITLHKLGRLEEALASYDRALAIKPDYADAQINRGSVLTGLKRVDEALASFSKALDIAPASVEAFNNRGNALRELKRFEEALMSYDNAIALDPNYGHAHNNRGVTLHDLGRFEDAIASYDCALLLIPDYAEVFYNRGNALRSLKRLDEALTGYDRAIAIQPNCANFHVNRGVTLKELHRLDEALASNDQALCVEPNSAAARSNKSLIYLMTGNFEQGWDLYEWRFSTIELGNDQRSFPQPRWVAGESIAGKTILLHAEQGIGDIIQFCRYAKLVAERGARVVLEAPVALKVLLEGLAGVSQIVEWGTALPEFDIYTPLLSLPLAFGTRLENIPSSVPYLKSNEIKNLSWSNRLGVKSRPRVGLVWSGNPHHTNDHNRSLRLEELLDYLPAGFDYVSLQKEVREDDREILNQSGLKQFSNELVDFSDTAALCELMDLIISVDTSVAHLAGALGKRTWILLPHVPDWRWLLERDDSPWYPTARLYRQSERGIWESVLRRVAQDLVKLETSESEGSRTPAER